MRKNENAQLVQLTTNLPRFSRKVVQGITPDGSQSAAYREPSPESFPRCLAETFCGAAMRIPSSSESARRGQKSSICEELVLENLASRKLTWANEKPHRANLPRHPFQTHISAISVHDADFSAKKEGPVASRRTKRQYHERPFAVDETAPLRSSRVLKCVQREEKPAKSRLSDGRAIEKQSHTKGCTSCPVGHLTSEGAIKNGPEFLPARLSSHGGDEGIRTLGPHVANVMLSQLSYIPTGFALLARR